MGERLASVRLRSSLHGKLRLLAADLSKKREVRITMRSMLEEGVRELFAVPLPTWMQWASQSAANFDALAANDPLESDSFRIDANLVRELGVLAAQISMSSKVPITKVHLLEEAGQRIIAQVEAEQREMDEIEQSMKLRQ